MTNESTIDTFVPDTWDGYIGQKDAKERLSKYINASLATVTPFQHTLLDGPPGCGKGLTLGTKVATPYGWAEIGDLEVGSPVIGSDGSTTWVTDIFDRGTLPVYRVTFSDDTSVLCDEDHLWQIKSRSMLKKNSKNSYTLSVRDLMERELHRDRGKNRKDEPEYCIPTVRAVQYENTELEVDPYLLGVLLANGSLSGNSIMITTNDEEIIIKIKERNPNVKLVEHAKGSARRWCVHGFNDVMKKLELKGKLSAQKFIPAHYLTAGEGDRRALLAGLMDCDGSSNGTRKPEYHSSSPHLIEGVKQLVWSLGGLTARVQIDNRTDVQYYDLPIKMSISPFWLGRKKRNDKWVCGNLVRWISSIEPEGEAKTRCIKVGAVDELFVIDQYLVTHNTTLAKIIANELGDEFLDLTMPVDTKVLEQTVATFQGVLFLDEIHRASKGQQEDLLTLMQQGFMTAKAGFKIEAGWLTIIGATTKPKMLDDAVLDRFQFRPEFVDYTNEEMAQIITGMVGRVEDVEIHLSEEQILELANAANGKPRACRELVLSARALVASGDELTVKGILRQAGVDEDGLDGHAMAYLNMINRFGGVAGLAKLANAMNLTPGHIQDIEKSLFRQEFIDHSDRGRRLTAKGYNKITTGNKEYTRKNAQ